MKIKIFLLALVIGFLSACSTRHDLKEGDCVTFTYKEHHLALVILKLASASDPQNPTGKDVVFYKVGDMDTHQVLGIGASSRESFEHDVFGQYGGKKVACETLG